MNTYLFSIARPTRIKIHISKYTDSFLFAPNGCSATAECSLSINRAHHWNIFQFWKNSSSCMRGTQSVCLKRGGRGGYTFQGVSSVYCWGRNNGRGIGVGVALSSIEFLMVNFGKKKKSSHSIFFLIGFSFLFDFRFTTTVWESISVEKRADHNFFQCFWKGCLDFKV